MGSRLHRHDGRQPGAHHGHQAVRPDELGNAPAFMALVVLNGGSGPFSMNDDACFLVLPGPIRPGGSCTGSITYTSPAACATGGATFQADLLRVDYNDGGVGPNTTVTTHVTAEVPA